ncbi:MAG: energy transducer TonB [Bacteroidales bacterium]
MIEFIKKHKKGVIGTLIFHGVLVIILFTMGFSTPLPLPAEQGILINFGDVEDASGANAVQKNIEETERQSIPEQSSPEPEPSEENEEAVVTQDYEEAPAIDQKNEEKKQEEESQPREEPEEKQEEEPEEEEEKEEEREVNENALYQGRSDEDSSDNEGKTEGEGNQGDPSGSPDAEDYEDEGSKGMGGIDYSLSGRNPESLPKPEYNYEEEGKVVVEIRVDRNGNVTDAVAGVKGSTTLDSELLRAAKEAALNAKFDRKRDAPAYQKGTITYNFRLQ